jgi:uncharacterized membrane protein
MKAVGLSVAGNAEPAVATTPSSLAAGRWLLITAFSLVACSQASESLDSSGQATGSTCPDDSALTYDSFASRFMQRYCTRCHAASLRGSDRRGAPSDHDFDTLEGLRLTHAQHIDEQAAAGPDGENSAMPPSSPKPSTDERRKLGEWLACGMP